MDIDRPTGKYLSDCGHRILAVTPRAPRTQLDTVAAEVGIMIGDLCETTDLASKLTEHLVQHPQPRWDFANLKQQAERFLFTLNPPKTETPSNQWYGFEIPSWAWINPEGWHEFEQAVTAELRRQLARWPPERRAQAETEIRRTLADYQQTTDGKGPFADPTPAQIEHYLIVRAGREHEQARSAIGRPIDWTRIPELRPKTRDK